MITLIVLYQVTYVPTCINATLVMCPLFSFLLVCFVGVRFILKALGKSIAPLFYLGVLTFLVITFLALIGIQFFDGALHGGCFASHFTPAGRKNYIYARKWPRIAKISICQMWGSSKCQILYPYYMYVLWIHLLCACSVHVGINRTVLVSEFPCPSSNETLPGTHSCPYGSTCTNWTEGPRRGIISFDNMGVAYLTVFQVISLEGWITILYLVSGVSTYLPSAVALTSNCT